MRIVSAILARLITPKAIQDDRERLAAIFDYYETYKIGANARVAESGLTAIVK